MKIGCEVHMMRIAGADGCCCGSGGKYVDVRVVDGDRVEGGKIDKDSKFTF